MTERSSGRGAEGSTTIITGSLGGGKSALAVEMIMEHLSLGGTVVTNIEVYPEKLAEWMRDEFGLVMDPDRLRVLDRASIRDFHDLAVRGNEERTVLMVLDEAALDLNAREWKTLPQELFNFVVLCRKLIIDLVLVAQDANDVDKQLRQKMQYEVHCRSLKKFLKLPIFVRVRYALELGKKPWRIGAKFRWKSEAFGRYNSKALHGERAQIFGALEQAKSGALERVQYPFWPYALCGVAVTVVSGVTMTLCLFVN